MALFWKVRSAGDVTAAYYGYENGLWWVRMCIGRRRITFWYRDGDYAAKVFYTAVGLTKGS